MSIRLVSNVASTARETDPRLINPVDVAVHCDKIYVSIPASNLVQVYSLKCGRLLHSLTVTTPTGLAFHCNTLYVGSRGGSIFVHGREPSSSTMPPSTTPAQPSMMPTVYLIVPGGGTIEGLTWHKNVLYATISDRGYVGAFKDKTAIDSITNESLFSFSYRPNGIQALDDRIYITYVDGTNSIGSGYVMVYNPKCKSLTNLIVRDALAYPYGLAMRDDVLLVGNRGTGLILAYDKRTGQRVENPSRELALSTNDGLMGMIIEDDKLVSVAANDNGLMGSVGKIELA